jgi:hypothetical protein
MLLNESEVDDMDDGLNKEKIHNLIQCLKPFLPTVIYKELIIFKGTLKIIQIYRRNIIILIRQTII